MELDPITKKLITKFLEIGKDRIQKITDLLIEIKDSPGSHGEELRAILGELHTLKGETRMLGLKNASELAHHMENVLKEIRDGRVSSLSLEGFFAALDAMEEMARCTLEGRTFEKDQGEIVKNLSALPHAEPSEGFSAAPPEETPKETPQRDSKASAEKPSDIKGRTLSIPIQKLEKISAGLEEMLGLVGNLKGAIERFSHLPQDIKELRDFFHLIKNKTFEKGEEDSSDLFVFREESTEGGKRLDKKMDRKLKNLLELSNQFQERLNHLLFDMERGSEELLFNNMNLLLMPLSMVTQPFQRGLLEMSRELGKKVKLLLKGGETELDKKILDRLGEPLLHLVRNALDHGIEFPKERLSLGKREEGTLVIEASAKGKEVEIRVSDDGRGIGGDEVLRKAIEKGFVSESEGENMGEKEKIELIFLPGFSTRSRSSQLSGRGMGMDIVGQAVQNMGGQILISSEEGKGTTFTLQLPLSLSLLPCLIVQVDSCYILIPSHYAREVFYLSDEDISMVNGQKMVSYENRLLPLAWLHSSLGFAPPAKERSKNPLILIGLDQENLSAVLVDRLVGEREVLLKPLDSFLKNHPYFSSATLLEEGEMAYLINLSKLGQRSYFSREPSPEGSQEKREKTILIVDDSAITREMEKTILESFGYEVLEAENGRRALALLETVTPDLIITDIEMPEMGGLEFTKTLRGIPQFRDLPVIVVSTKDTPEDKFAGLDAGADGYIVKGEFQNQSFIETVKRWI